MQDQTLTAAHLLQYRAYLTQEEKSGGTIKKYLRDVQRFARWLGGRPVTKEASAGWRETLAAGGYAPATVNGMLAALNHFFRYMGWEGVQAKSLKIQRQMFRDPARELTRSDYERLLAEARRRGKSRLLLLMETVCATGIRVSEVKYITVEAAHAGRTQVRLKGKIRTILLPSKLCRQLLSYAKKRKTASGEIFLTRSGKPISRKQIWAEMKALCQRAGVSPGKVFPHNLRHLFARAFYKQTRDMVKLADILGHSSVATTRIYLISTGAEHQRELEKLNLIC